MIDYDKLRIANDDLLQHLKNMESTQTNYLKCMKKEDDAYTYGHAEGYMMCYQEVIDKIESLTQPKAKYEVGQKVWFIDRNNKISHAEIDEVDVLSDEKYYIRAEDWWFMEHELHETKAKLIESQIEHWTKLKIDEISASKTCPKCGMQRVADRMCWNIGCDYKECQHEPEMDFGKDSRPRFEKGNNPKCKHCGELYLLECQHESDGNYYHGKHGLPAGYKAYSYSDLKWRYKCLKCGEFYRD